MASERTTVGTSAAHSIPLPTLQPSPLLTLQPSPLPTLQPSCPSTHPTAYLDVVERHSVYIMENKNHPAPPQTPHHNPNHPTYSTLPYPSSREKFVQLDSEFKQIQRELDQTKREKQSGQERNRILEEQNEVSY